MSDLIQKTSSFLMARGYKKYNPIAPGVTRCFYRKVDSRFMCRTNGHVSLTVELYDLAQFPRMSGVDAVMGIRHETQQRRWVKLEIYGLRVEQLIEDIDALEARVIKMWEAANDD